MSETGRPIVWVLKEQVKSSASGITPMDYTAALKFGDLQFMTDFDIPLHHSSSVADEWFKAISRVVKVFDQERDYIILTGQPLAMFICGQMFQSAGIRPRILVWRRQQEMYVVYNSMLDFVQSTR